MKKQQTARNMSKISNERLKEIMDRRPYWATDIRAMNDMYTLLLEEVSRRTDPADDCLVDK